MGHTLHLPWPMEAPFPSMRPSMHGHICHQPDSPSRSLLLKQSKHRAPDDRFTARDFILGGGKACSGSRSLPVSSTTGPMSSDGAHSPSAHELHERLPRTRKGAAMPRPPISLPQCIMISNERFPLRNERLLRMGALKPAGEQCFRVWCMIGGTRGHA